MRHAKTTSWLQSLLLRLLMAVLLSTGTLAHATDIITYIHPDISGSPLAATNEAGAVVWKESYRAYGQRAVQMPTGNDQQQWFHGKEQDPVTGLQYFGARYYDPAVGRFLGIDPVDFQEGNPHSFNRFAYGNNNPIAYLDPDGQYPFLVRLQVMYYRYAPAVTGFIAGASGVNGAVTSPMAVSPAVAQIPGHVSRFTPVATAVQSGIESGAYAVPKAAANEGLIYRAASGTPTSMTPRAVDSKGLSAANSLASALPGRNQVIDTSKLKNLCAVCDNPKTGHVSITPIDLRQMQGWINSRGGTEVHPLTRELMDAVIGTVKK